MNKIRGIIGIEHNNHKYNLTPSFAALAEIEGELDMSLIELIDNIEIRGLKLREIEVIFKSGLKASKEKYNSDFVKKMIADLGIIKATKYAVSFLSTIFANEESK